MISVILYGRNDAHGYNLHRRAALSLNCIAQVLTDPDDEIVFVDYNTPDGLPTFVEAISDTLTERCLDRLQVLRVPASVHEERFGKVTSLPALEPVARNAGVRRSNPANRWLLSTNTDMVLVPLDGASLSKICHDLPDGFYGLPRYELPEWLWERLPRSDPEQTLSEIARLGPRLHLNETTLGHKWVRFDGPGDFQLLLRDDFVAIDGLDESMVLGWHVDSNLSRRMAFARGVVTSLDDRVAGYHCNHSRTPTVYHGAGAAANDLTRFYLSVERPDLPAQRETWGFSDIELEEVPLGRSRVDLARALVSVIPPPDGPKTPVDPLRLETTLTYDSCHVFPFVADAIAVSPRRATIGYLGANARLEEMLAQLVSELAIDGGPTLVTAGDETGVAQLDAADVLIVDLGFDRADRSAGALQRDRHSGLPNPPRALHGVVAGLTRLVELERARLTRGEHPRRFVLVNSDVAYVERYVRSEFETSATTFHARVRRAFVAREPQSTGLARPLRNLLFLERLEKPRRPLALKPDKPVELWRLPDFRGFGEGWAVPDAETIWTQGGRAELLLSCPRARGGRHVFSLSFGRVGVRPADSLPVTLSIDGRRVAARSFAGGVNKVRWRVPMPPGAIAKPSFEVVLDVAGDGIWPDERELGLHVHSFDVRRDGIRRRLEDGTAALRASLERLRARGVPIPPLRFWRRGSGASAG